MDRITRGVHELGGEYSPQFVAGTVNLVVVKVCVCARARDLAVFGTCSFTSVLCACVCLCSLAFRVCVWVGVCACLDRPTQRAEGPKFDAALLSKTMIVSDRWLEKCFHTKCTWSPTGAGLCCMLPVC